MKAKTIYAIIAIIAGIFLTTSMWDFWSISSVLAILFFTIGITGYAEHKTIENIRNQIKRGDDFA